MGIHASLLPGSSHINIKDMKVHRLTVSESQFNSKRRMDDNSLKRELLKYDTEGLYVTHLPESLREVFIYQSRQKDCPLKIDI